MVMKREKVRKREKTEGPTCRVYAPHFIIDFSYSVPTVSKQSFLLLRAVSVFICHFFLLERENFSARIAGIFTFFFFYSVSFPHFISFFFCYTKTKTSSSIHIGTFNFSDILSSFSINNLWIFLILEFFHSSKNKNNIHINQPPYPPQKKNLYRVHKYKKKDSTETFIKIKPK